MSRRSVSEGSVLWVPSAERVEAARISSYRRWLEERTGAEYPTYAELWRYSVDQLEEFWRSVLEFFDVPYGGDAGVALAERRLPGADWFPDVRLNYAEVALRRRDEAPALIARREDGLRRELSFADVAAQVGSVSAALRDLGVGPGDRVASCLPNIPEAVVALLACASIGAIWASCSPDFGTQAAVDRFRQIEPKLLLGVDGYLYNGRRVERLEELAALRRELPSVEAAVLVDYLDRGREAPPPLGNAIGWPELCTGAASPRFERLPFSQPLWILYSSGATGLPKGIVHGHGGIVLEHLKSGAFHFDLGPDDRHYWFTSTGWMIWNVLAGSLLTGTAAVLYDGSPVYPDPGATWRVAEEEGVTFFGTSPPFLGTCANAGLSPRRVADLSALRILGCAGSPASPELGAWVYEEIGQDVFLYCGSGGTEVAGGLVSNVPVLPVYAGEMAAPCLGVAAAAFDPDGRAVVGEVGELVITEPMPSMPLRLWNDPDGARLRASYFDVYPGVWRHGDWIRFTERGSSVIPGRSDATLNRGGVRMGTAEFYRVVEALPEVADSLVVDTGQVWLFVVMAEGAGLTPELEQRIRRLIRESLSPRHEPDEIRAAPAVPRTLNGKKLEVPVKRILAGDDPGRVVNPGAVSNPDALEYYIALAREVAG
jgi:acetoacetyl-CoA synthetase